MMDDNGVLTVPEEIEGPSTAPSILDNVRAAHRRNLKLEDFLELSIPVTDHLLAVRYKRASWGAIEPFAAMADDPTAAMGRLDGITNALIASCVSILYLQDDGSYLPLHEAVPDLGVNPVRFDARLADLLGHEDPGTAREVVRLTFGTDRDLDIIDHGSQLVAYSVGGAKRVNEVVLGESLGDRR